METSLTKTAENPNRHPAGLLKLCFVEVWERFGFATTMALAVLYFASPVTGGGLGWSNADALLWLGYFAALLMTLPMFGGWAADAWLGNKRAILVGGCMMAVGYLAMGCLPYVFEFTGIDAHTLNQIFGDAGLALARPAPDALAWARVSAAIELRVGPQADAVIASVRTAYFVQTTILWLALLMVACGNALLKPNISATVGALYRPGDERRDGGFTLFWTFINAGSLLGYVIGGGVGESLGWNFGYLAAFLGMSSGLIYFLFVQRQLPDLNGSASKLNAAPKRASLTRHERRRTGAIVIMTAFAIVFHTCHGQLNTLIGLFLLQDVDRIVGTFEVPVLWVTAINPLVILILAPVAAMLWTYLGRRGRNPSALVKFVMALVCLAFALAIFAFAAVQAEGPQKAALVWIAIAVVIMSIAEFPLQPIGLSMVTRLAPAHLVGLMMGAWLFGMAVAYAIGGNVGALASIYGLVAAFSGMTIACLAAACGLLLTRGLLDRWMAIEPAEPVVAIPGDVELKVG